MSKIHNFFDNAGVVVKAIGILEFLMAIGLAIGALIITASLLFSSYKVYEFKTQVLDQCIVTNVGDMHCPLNRMEERKDESSD